MLRDLNALDQILDSVCEQAQRLGMRISVKTRMGDHSTAEFPDILEVFNRYPLSRLIVHARCRDDFYQGPPDLQGFRDAAGRCLCPLVFNGSITSPGSLDRLLNTVTVDAVMIGRGAVADPALFRELSGGPPLSSEELSVFLDRLTARWLADGLGPAFTLERMKALWFYMKDLFPDDKSQIKAILKAKSLEEYRPAVSSLLSSSAPQPLR
jgi:tRNA-dihydrouridine synthase